MHIYAPYAYVNPTKSTEFYQFNRNISLGRVHLISFGDSPIRSVFPETTPPYVTITIWRENVIFLVFLKTCGFRLIELNLISSVISSLNPNTTRRFIRACMFSTLNRRKCEMCEMVSKCLRKVDHYGCRFCNQNKA